MSVVHVFTDESGTHAAAPFLVIGGIWAADNASYSEFTTVVNDHCNHFQHAHEIGWKNIQPRFIDCYKSIINDFFADDRLSYYSISVDKSKVDYNKYHKGNTDLGFYKFYYQLLVQRMDPSLEYWLRLDRKSGMKKYLKPLQDSCNNKLRQGNPQIVHNPIKTIHQVDSIRNPLTQVADLFTGAISASYTGIVNREKQEIADHIANRINVPRLNMGTPFAVRNKYNNWEILLK